MPKVARTICRLMSLAILTALALPAVSWWVAQLLPGAISPLVMLGAAVATRAVSIATLLGVPLLIAVILRQRFFCRYVCPTGLLIDGVGRLHGCFRRATPPATDDPEDASDAVETTNSSSVAPRRAKTTLGQHLALLTLGGAVIGWPLFLWLDPMAIYSGFLGAFHRPVTVAALAGAMLLPAVLLITLFFPRLWCGKVCPLGGLQDLIAHARRSHFGFKGNARSAARGSTFQCRVGHPLDIGMSTHGQPPRDTRPRRWVLAAIAGGAGGWLLRKAVPAQARVLRPPAAEPETAFTELCIRCGACIRACPADILHADLGRQGIAGLLAPELRIGDRWCKDDCIACTQVCPSGAIRRITLDQKPGVRIGLPVLDKPACVRSDNGECSACASICPYEAITFKFDSTDYTSLPEVDRAKCNGCGACEVACPATPKALRVRAV